MERNKITELLQNEFDIQGWNEWHGCDFDYNDLTNLWLSYGLDDVNENSIRKFKSMLPLERGVLKK